VVISASSGPAISANRAISPGALVAISRTQTSASAGARRIVSGSPIRLFQLPGVLWTAGSPPSAEASISFTVVFPELPVMPTTRAPLRRR